MDKFIIYTKTVDFIAWLFPTINKFPKSQRFVLGQQIEIVALKFLAELDVDLQVLRARERQKTKALLEQDEFIKKLAQTPLSKLTGIELLLAALYRHSDLFPKELVEGSHPSTTT